MIRGWVGPRDCLDAAEKRHNTTPSTLTQFYRDTWCGVVWATELSFFSGVRLSSLGTAATSGLLYKLQMIDEGDCGVFGGIKIGRGNRSTRRKPTPAPLCPPQIPHDQTRTRTRAVAVGSQRLTAWAMARPKSRFTAGWKRNKNPLSYVPMLTITKPSNCSERWSYARIART
jgi:hypothetical protein